MKKNIYTKAIFLVVLLFLLFYTFYHFKKEPSSLFHHQTFSSQIIANDISAIEITTTTTHIHIMRSEKNHFSAAMTSDSPAQNTLSLQKANGALHIQVQNKKENIKSELLIKIPATTKTIQIKSTLGNIRAEHLSLETLNIETLSGDIAFNDVNAEKSTLLTNNGDISWKGQINTLSLMTSAGNVQLKLTTLTPHFQIKTLSGDVVLTLPTKAYTHLKINTQSGDVVVNGKTIGKSINVNLGTEKRSNNVQIQTARGNVTVSNQ